MYRSNLTDFLRDSTALVMAGLDEVMSAGKG